MSFLSAARSVAPQPISTRTEQTQPDELVSALRAVPVAVAQPIDWPPLRPAWFAEWMVEDDRRRAETMAAGKARLARR
jgi:hypothetical protein